MLRDAALSVFPRKLLIPTLLVFVLALPVFARLVFVGVGPKGETTDYRLHINLALELLRKGTPQPHPLFHGLLLVLIGGDNPAAAPGIVAFLMALAVASLTWLTAYLLDSSGEISTLALTLLCIALLIAMPLPNWWNWPNVCRGQVAANAWYNPTGIVAMPFALALFLVGLRVLQDSQSASFGAVSAVLILSLLAKPNYVLTFAPCFGVLLVLDLVHSIRNGKLTPVGAARILIVVFAPATLILGLQYLSLYSGRTPTGGRLLYAPFAVWSLFTKGHVGAAILLGIAFPLAATLLYPRQANRDTGLVLAWATLALGMLQFALFAESGDRIIHVNLSWGMMLAAHVLFVVCCGFLLRQPPGARRWLAFGVLGLQAASGAMCLVRSLMEPWLAITF